MGYEWLPSAFRALWGIEPYEVMQVIYADRRWPVPAVSAEGVRMLTIWGRTAAGRPLIATLLHDNNLDWLIVGAREMTGDELVVFERWEATP